MLQKIHIIKNISPITINKGRFTLKEIKIFGIGEFKSMSDAIRHLKLEGYTDTKITKKCKCTYQHVHIACKKSGKKSLPSVKS